MILELTDDGRIPVYFISTNKGKIEELKTFFNTCTNIKLMSLRDLYTDVPDIDEPFTTFKANASHKAYVGFREIKRLTGKRLNIIADDSGLTIDALERYPGVITKRFLPNSVNELIKDLSPEEASNVRRDVLMWFMDMYGHIRPSSETRGRKAHYDSAIHMIIPLLDDDVCQFRTKGTVTGTIVKKLDDCRGNNGFTFDQMFIPTGMDKTLAELSVIEKLRISHRGKALMDLMVKLTTQYPKLGFKYYQQKLFE